MPITLRLDQIVTFTVDWRDSTGNVAPAPADAAAHVGNSDHLRIDDLGHGTYKLTPLALGDNLAIAVASAEANAVDNVNVEGGQAVSGTIVWGTPEANLPVA